MIPNGRTKEEAKTWIPTSRHPGNLQAGVQKYLKNKEKNKNLDSR